MDVVFELIRRQVEDNHDHDHDHDHDDHDHDHVETVPATAGGESHSGHSHGFGCGSGGAVDVKMGLRIAAIFIILFASLSAAVFPILAKRTTIVRVPKSVYDFVKFFGSGVILATAFIHLLAHGLHALESECLGEAWHAYPYGLGLCLLAIFAIFVIELIAVRWGNSKLAASQKSVGTDADLVAKGKGSVASDVESVHKHDGHFADSIVSKIIGVAILEFGVVLHSILIGLTLAVDEEFKVLFVVLLFHQTFEGLGIGVRLAQLELPEKYRWYPLAGAVLFGLTTPVGIAAGLGVRATYNPGTATASIVTGVMDSLSAGILIYTALVELIAHEFLYDKGMMQSSNGKLAFALGSMALGCGLMALLGRWA